MASLEDVARAAGVSTATVSRALSGRGRTSEATRERVRTIASDLGYVASASAASLASGRAENIGVVVPLMDRWFFATVLDGIATRLAGHGYDLTLYNLTDDRDQRRRLFSTSLRRGRVDGVIVLSVALSDDEVAQLGELGRPVLGLGLPRGGLTTLRVDDTAVGRAAAQHLLDLGHRHIAHLGQSVGTDAGSAPAGSVADPCRPGATAALAAVTASDAEGGPEAAGAAVEPGVGSGGTRSGGTGSGGTGSGNARRDAEYDIPTRRRRGFEAAMADAGVVDPLFVATDFTVDDGRRALRELWRSSDPPTAIFAASDEMAFGVLAEARELGIRVPEDLSVIGVDGHDLAGLFELTTVDQFPHAQGERAAEAILAEVGVLAEVGAGDTLSGAPAASRTGPASAASLPFAVVARGTTAAPGSAPPHRP